MNSLDLFCSKDRKEIAKKINQIIKAFDERAYELSKGLEFEERKEHNQLVYFSALSLD